MKLETVAIPQPTVPNPLPTDWQEICNVFYGFWHDLNTQVRANNAALKDGCCDTFIAPDVPGMMRAPYQDEIAAVMPAKVNAAVVLANANYQIGNGGFAQYHDNGYSKGLPTVIQLLEGAKALGVPQTAEALEIFQDFATRLRIQEEDERARTRFSFSDLDGDGDDDCDEGPSDPYGDLEDRYYALRTDEMGQAVLDRFQDILEASFRPVMHRARAA